MTIGRLRLAAACRGVAMCATLVLALRAEAQLRIVTYNTATAQNPGTQTIRPGHLTVLQAIGLESVAGIARPIDVLLLQEQFSMQVTTQSFVEALNSIYGAGTYARSTLNGLTSDSLGRAGRPGLVYNTQTVQLVGETFFGDVGTTTSQQPRSTLRYALKPVGYGDSAIFYAYNSHYKSDTGADENMRRLVEAQAIRTNADALAEGTHIIYAGDYNIQSSNGAAYQHLLSAGNGQAFDPINMPGSWNSNNNFRALHTQSPATESQFNGQTLGGLDDRFDIQLVSGEMLDGEGLSYISGTYRAFGNNGTHTCCNSPITTGTGASPEVLLALMQSSDHIPVVADYQLPAKMGVQVAKIPSLVELGASVAVAVTVTNTAPTALAIGADELDYTLSVAGSLIGGVSGTDPAGGGGNLHQFLLDTSSLGMKSGTLSVTATSQQAANSSFTLPINFQVIASFLEADFNKDGAVNAVDLAAWKSNFGLAGGAVRSQGDANGDGVVDAADFAIWQRQVGQLPAGAALAAAVPEPATVALVALASLVAMHGRRRRVTGGE